MATVRELVTVWGFDVDAKPLKDLDDRVAKLKTRIRDVSLVGGTAAAGLFGLAKITANLGEESLNAAMMLRMTVEEFQEYTRAADIADLSTEEFTSGLGFLLNSAGNVKNGSKEASEAFARVGVSALDANGNIKPTAQLFNEVSDGLMNIADEGMRVNVARDLLGRGGGRMVHVMAQGSEAFAKMRDRVRETGVIMSQEAAEAANKFNDELDYLKFTIYGLRNDMGNGLIPILTDLFTGMREWILANREMIKQNLVGFIKGMVGAARTLMPIIMGVAGAILGLVNILGGAEKVTRTFVQLWMLWQGANIVAGIAGIAGGVLNLAKAMGVLRLSALPVVAAFAVLVLMVLDFMDYISGDTDTVFGRIVADLKSIFSDIQDLVYMLGTFLKDFGSSGLMKYTPTGWVAQAVGGAMTAPPSVRVGPGPGRGSSTTNNVGPTSVSAPIGITVNGAGDPQATGTAVASAVGLKMDEILRGVQQDNAPVLAR